MPHQHFQWLLIAVLAGTVSPQRAIGQLQDGATIRVAAVSFVPKKFDLQGNADRLERAFRQAKKGKAKLAVAPEGALDGYVVNAIIAGEEPARRMNDVAVTIDDPVIQRFQKLGRELEMCLVFGFAERINQEVFNSAVFIDHLGKISGKYHKMQFAEGYDSAWWFNRLGKRSRSFDTPLGRCGIMICNDRWNPQLARIPVLDGAQFLIVPAFGSRSSSQDKAVLSRGKENNVPVVEANVGVTLIVDQGKITAVNREEEGITFGQITISSPAKPQPKQRDDVERLFLKWRQDEMKRRLSRTRKRVQNTAVANLKKLGARIRLDEQGRVIEVNLQETKTGTADLRLLAVLQDVREVSLHRTKVTNVGLAHLQGLIKLEKLFLSDTKIGNRGLQHLSRLQNLRVLGLSGTHVSDDGLIHLTKLKALESLFLLDAKVTSAGAEKFQKARPHCNVVR